jgi:hypothetical protein
LEGAVGDLTLVRVERGARLDTELEHSDTTAPSNAVVSLK